MPSRTCDLPGPSISTMSWPTSCSIATSAARGCPPRRPAPRSVRRRRPRSFASPGAHQRVVVHQQHPDRRAGLVSRHGVVHARWATTTNSPPSVGPVHRACRRPGSPVPLQADEAGARPPAAPARAAPPRPATRLPHVHVQPPSPGRPPAGDRRRAATRVLGALVSASCTIRYRPRPTAAGGASGVDSRRRWASIPARRVSATSSGWSTHRRLRLRGRPRRRRHRAVRRSPRATPRVPCGCSSRITAGGVARPPQSTPFGADSSPPACTLIIEIRWASTSCISRAMRARSARRASRHAQLLFGLRPAAALVQ